MKFSFSTNAFTRHSVVSAVEKIAKIGYHGVEILADAPHLYADNIAKDLLEQIKSVLKKNGLAVANINANTAVGYYNRTFWEPLFEPSLANPKREARKWRLGYTKKCVDIACALGASSISITSGRMVPGTLPAESLVFLRDSIDELLVYAESKGVKIGIEYEPGLIIGSCADLSHFLNSVDSPFLGANLDIGHSQVAGEDLPEVIAGLGENIFHVHLEDIKGRQHYHLLPGKGDIDFDAVITALEKQSYKGFLTVELYSYPQMPEEAAFQALEFLTTVTNKTFDKEGI